MASTKRARPRPHTVLDAGNEINKIGATVVHLSLAGEIPQKLRTAAQACLQAYSQLQGSAISAMGVAARRMDTEDNYTDPWARQWRRPHPPTTSDELMHELPLWYLAQIVKSLRTLMAKDAGLAWDSSPDEWARIGSAMRVAKDAIRGGSLEARTTAGSRLKATRTERKKTRGPRPERAVAADTLHLVL